MPQYLDGFPFKVEAVGLTSRTVSSVYDEHTSPLLPIANLGELHTVR